MRDASLFRLPRISLAPNTLDALPTDIATAICDIARRAAKGMEGYRTWM